jgi:hypothetical protein
MLSRDAAATSVAAVLLIVAQVSCLTGMPLAAISDELSQLLGIPGGSDFILVVLSPAFSWRDLALGAFVTAVLFTLEIRSGGALLSR